MHVVTTSEVPGHTSHAVLGLVQGTSMVSTHAVGDVMASMKNFFGGKVSNYERMVNKAREEALKAIVTDAHAKGANAIVGLSVDIELMAYEKGGFLCAFALGTAVLAEPNKANSPI